jgi:hypothetical protein
VKLAGIIEKHGRASMVLSPKKDHNPFLHFQQNLSAKFSEFARLWAVSDSATPHG